MIASTAGPESSGICGISGSPGWAQTAMKNDSAMRSRIGTPRCANTGIVAEQREHAQERPQERRDPGQDLGVGEGMWV